MKCFYCDTEIVVPTNPGVCPECQDILKHFGTECVDVIRAASEAAKSSGLRRVDVRKHMIDAAIRKGGK